MANTPNLDLENVNVLLDTDYAYNQLVSEIIAKINNNNLKIDELPNNFILSTEKGAVNGVASLGNDGIIPKAQLPIDSGSVERVIDITARDAITNLYDNKLVFVIDASDDITVTSGWAMYIYNTSSSSWTKIIDVESLDTELTWDNIEDKPTVFPPEPHTHEQIETNRLDIEALIINKVDKISGSRLVSETEIEVFNDKYSKTEIDDKLSDLSSDAIDINYSNITSSLTSTNIQDAIDELDAQVDTNKTDILSAKTTLGSVAMTTSAQTVTGAINELDADIGNKATLITTDKTNLVNAVNENREQINSLDAKTLGFITPEMFGAVGNGVINDTVAIQTTINYAITNKKTVLLSGTYVIDTPLKINKTVAIIGVNSSTTITTNNSILDSFFVIEELETLADIEKGKYISIKNITLQNAMNSNAYGIKYNDCAVLYNELYNIIFNNFNNPCIYLNSIDGYSNLGVYSHNIEWNHIYTFGCSSIVGQYTSTSSQPYIYGGNINDVHFEGVHNADNNGNQHILDLKGFRNVNLSNIIMEGTLLSQKTSCLRLTYSCNIENIYFEFAIGSILPTNTMRIESVPASKMYIKGCMGNFYAPIYLLKCDLTIHMAFTNYLGEKLGSANNIIDVNSSSYKLTFENAYYGAPWSLTDNKRIIPYNVLNKSVVLDSILSVSIDDAVPLLSVDLSQIKVGTGSQNKYNNLVYIWEHSSFVGKTILTTGEDYFTGKYAVLKSDGTTTNFLRCGIYLNLALLPINNSEYVTVVITVKPNVTPANGNINVSGTITEGASNNKYYQVTNGTSALCYGSKLKTEDKYFTLIYPMQKYAGGYYIFKFDEPITDEYCDIVQEYAIVDFTVFKGLHYGKCVSKLVTQDGSFA